MVNWIWNLSNFERIKMSAVQKAIRDFEVKSKENEPKTNVKVKQKIEKFEKKNVQSNSGRSHQPKSIPKVIEKSTDNEKHIHEEFKEECSSPTCQILSVSPKIKEVHFDDSSVNDEDFEEHLLDDKNIPTVISIDPFYAENDATDLKEAMGGFGCNNAVITEIIGNRTFDQRSQIELAYKEIFNKDLIEDLKSELGGNFESLVKGLMLPRNHYIASLLKKAMKGLGTIEDSLIYLLFSVGNDQMAEICSDYKGIYENELENDIANEIRGDFKELVLAVMKGFRNEEAPVDKGKAQETVNQLFGTDGTLNKSVLIDTLVLNSYAQLLEINSVCESITEKSLEEICEKEMSNDFIASLKTIFEVAKNEHVFWANKLHYAMAGLGTDDNTLINIIVLRAEIDLGNIAYEYERIYEKSLKDAIEEECSGDYKNLLIEILN